MNIILKLIVILTLVLSATSAHAVSIINNFGLTTPGITIEFDEDLSIPTDTAITNQYESLGITISPNLYQSNVDGSLFPNIDNHNLGSSISTNTVRPFTLHFVNDQTKVAFAMVTNMGTTSFEAFLGTVPVESFSTATNVNANNFYGFKNIVFNSIVVNVTPGISGTMFMDNLQLGSTGSEAPIPEPATLLLMGVGIAGLIGGAAGKKLKKK